MTRTIGKVLYGAAAGLSIVALSVRLASRKRSKERLGIALGLGVPILAFAGKLLEDMGAERFMTPAARFGETFEPSLGAKQTQTLRSAFDRDQSQGLTTAQANYANH